MGQPDPSNLLPLTPLATRLCDGLESIEDFPQIAMVAAALRKQMHRKPVPDSEILEQLVWVQEMIHAIIVGPEETGLSEGDLSILDTLGNGEDLIKPHSLTGESDPDA
jgi:hypothetical protein